MPRPPVVEFSSVKVFQTRWELNAFPPPARERIPGPGQRLIEMTQVARIRHPGDQDLWVGGRRDSVGSVVNVCTLDNARHVAIEAGDLTGVVATMGLDGV